MRILHPTLFFANPNRQARWALSPPAYRVSRRLVLLGYTLVSVADIPLLGVMYYLYLFGEGVFCWKTNNPILTPTSDLIDQHHL